MLLRQNTAFNRPIFLGATLLSPTITLSKNGGAFAAIAGTVTELSGGWYMIELAAADTHTLGSLAYLSSAGTMPADLCDQVLADLPAKPGDLMGLADGAITDATITVPSAPTGPADTILTMIVQLWRRFFAKTTRDATTIKTYADDSTTVLTTQTYTTGSTDTVGPAS